MCNAIVPCHLHVIQKCYAAKYILHIGVPIILWTTVYRFSNNVQSVNSQTFLIYVYILKYILQTYHKTEQPSQYSADTPRWIPCIRMEIF